MVWLYFLPACGKACCGQNVFPPARSNVRPSGSKPNDYIFGLVHDCVHGNKNCIHDDVIICCLGMDAKNVPGVPGHINMY